jgi:uncharacterized cupin superfamily protein
MFDAIVPPGGGPPPHIHSREEESFLILEGEITFTVGGQKIVAITEAFANMPVGFIDHQSFSYAGWEGKHFDIASMR